jgi:hypothetical protein
MKKLLKLANSFEKKSQDVFGELSWKEESDKLHHLAGKILYKSNKAENPTAAKKLREAGELMLRASDILKGI